MVRTKQTARKPVCPICRGYTTSKEFIAHVRQCEENHSCTKCNKMFKKTVYLKKHMSRVHAEVKAPTETIQIDKTKKTQEPLNKPSEKQSTSRDESSDNDYELMDLKNKPSEKNMSEIPSTTKDESSDSNYDFMDFAPDIEIGELEDRESTDESKSDDESENETTENPEEKNPNTRKQN
ncbi:uncharacterized protein LOC128558841 [Mercenaria mercenaria]|uniref:uncharacterized protein LOC128558841 n=1 Tax=Mercenaria mercenaria TaxID=6596 RepID=UPI00234EA1C4|nr:uncharacterized protein LOC128558841 [Mercenaria mercenaria]